MIGREDILSVGALRAVFVLLMEQLHGRQVMQHTGNIGNCQRVITNENNV